MKIEDLRKLGWKESYHEAFDHMDSEKSPRSREAEINLVIQACAQQLSNDCNKSLF